MAADSVTDQRADTQEHQFRVLITRLVARDQAALVSFYDATSARAYALALRITGQPAAAEEVVSDVYFQVWQQAERYDAARGRVLAWLLTICRSRALDWLRRRDDAELHPEPQTLRPDIYRDDEGPMNMLMAVERNSGVHAALAVLNETQQKLLSLAFFRGMTHQEIARHTGMPLGSVKTTLRKAMQTLKQLLGDNPLSPEKSS